MASSTTETLFQPSAGPPSLIAILKPDAQIRARGQGLVSLDPAQDVSSLDDILKSHGATLKLLFGPSEDRLKHERRQFVRKAVAASLTGFEDSRVNAALEEVGLFS
jgi:hypothetical protein